MRRKVVQQGPATLMVSIPSKWARKLGLRKGDDVDIEESRGQLVIGSKVQKKKNIAIRLGSSYPKYVRSILRNLYIHGYESIDVEYNNEKDYVVISDFLDSLLGYEIVKESKQGCVIQSVTDIKYEQYVHFLNKQFHIIKTMQEMLHEDMLAGTTRTNASIINSLAKKSSKFSCMCRRVLTKHGLMNHDDSIIIFFVFNLIHMIARCHWHCYDYIHGKKPIITKEARLFLDEERKLFNQLYELYLKKNQGSLEITEKKHKLLTKTLPKYFSKGADAMVLHYLADAARLIGVCAPKISLMNDFMNDEISNELKI